MVALWPFMGLRVVMDIERIINHTGRKPPLHYESLLLNRESSFYLSVAEDARPGPLNIGDGP